MDYIIINNGDFVSTDELRHWGVKGMKWGVRRWQNVDGTLTNAGKKRYSKSGYVTSLDSRETDRWHSADERKKRIDANIKEADDRVKFYGSKRAAKAAIAEEAAYVKSVNRGRAWLNTFKYGVGTGTAAAIAGIAAESAAVTVIGLATPIAVVGATSAVLAAKANDYVRRHANDQVKYTDESEYGHDMVVALKRH